MYFLSSNTYRQNNSGSSKASGSISSSNKHSGSVSNRV